MSFTEFDSLPIDDGQRADIVAVRTQTKALAAILENHVPDGRGKALAMTKLQEITFWANWAISHGPRR